MAGLVWNLSNLDTAGAVGSDSDFYPERPWFNPRSRHGFSCVWEIVRRRFGQQRKCPKWAGNVWDVRVMVQSPRQRTLVA